MSCGLGSATIFLRRRLIVDDSIVHVILLVLRTKIAYQTKIWKRPWTLVSLPTGQVTFEFSMKLYRKPEPTVGQQNAQREQEGESLV